VARAVVIGGGIVGLSTAMLLGKDGHDVTVLERDPQAPPADIGSTWPEWQRRSVGQFRMLHFFLARFRQVMQAELPDVVTEFEALGAKRYNVISEAPSELTGGAQPGDDDYEVITARRPVGESALARVASRMPNVAIRRGVVIKALLTDDTTTGAIPHVVGVRTDDGEDVRADFVVDASGRRSALPSLIAAAGGRAPEEELDDCGFIYYGRHFRANDGSTPFVMGPLRTSYGSVSTLTLPADNGTWGIGVITSARDTAMRGLKDVDTWMRTVKAFPLAAHWLDGEPIDDGIAIMAKIEDRHRSFVVDGAPVATGLFPVGDSWACTNPSVGRGMSIGVLHALALRDLLRDGPTDDPVALAHAWHDATMATVEPWYRATLSFDRHRLAEIEAIIAGVPYETDDPAWEITQALQYGSSRDPAVFRAFLKLVNLQALPDELLAQPGLFEKVVEAGKDWRDAPAIGPDRDELVKIVAA
jgi:2-polyprenyl-6-methoxyphenol hydroxylase-like FAD-dependent oxidoreductase